MGKLKPIGSEKLEGFDKIQRMIEISNYNLNTPKPINEDKSLEFQKTLADGITYHIVKEKNGYVLKKGGLNESTSEYLEPMKHRKYYSSYSQAMKRLNLIVKEVNYNEGYSNNLSLFNESDEVKYFLKRPKTEQAEPGQQQAPAPQAPAPQAPAPAPTPQAPAPTPEDGDDMDIEDEPMDEPQDNQEGGETVTYKTIQKLVGKLGQKTREFLSNEENQLDTKQVKYIINSILSALPLESLEDEDREEIMTKFEGGGEDVEGSEDFDMEGEDMGMGDEDMGMESEDMGSEFDMPPAQPQQPAPQAPAPPQQPKSPATKSQEMKEVIENIFNESKVDKVLGKYFGNLPKKSNKNYVNEQSVTSTCKKTPDWLLEYKMDGKLGKQNCNELRWDISKAMNTEFLVLHMKDQTVFLSVSTDKMDETAAEAMAKLFRMNAPKINRSETFYLFNTNYGSAELNGDLNKLLDSLQGKIPFMNSINESFKKIKKLSESYKQELTTLNILNEHPSTKLIGKNEFGEILLLNGKRLLTINRNGKIK